MTIDNVGILIIISLASLLFNILQQQKIKSMKFAINILEDEIADKSMVIQALKEHVEPSDTDHTQSEQPNSETKQVEIESDAQPNYDLLTREDVFNHIITHNLKPIDTDEFNVVWYFPSKYAFEHTPPDLTVAPWSKTFEFNLNTK